jgi:hypothetical protein
MAYASHEGILQVADAVIYRFRRPLGNHFDLAFRNVSHVARELASAGDIQGGKAKTNALNAS